MFRNNRGEWSEIYVFVYLLYAGKLYAADKDMQKLDDFFPVVKIIREENDNERMDYKTGDYITILRNGEEVAQVDKAEFDNAAMVLLEKIPQGSSAFEIPEIEDFFRRIFVTKIKEKASKKEDITIQIHDIHTGITAVQGFSIKSFFGSNPTLMNPGKNTNFSFIVTNCNDDIMNYANSADGHAKLIQRMTRLTERGCELIPIEHSISFQFESNLMFIDSRMPELLQLLVLYSYKYMLYEFTDILERIKADNPMQFPVPQMYDYKAKKLLCAFALGLTPEKEWYGVEDANGGYITVREDGEVVCYHVYNRGDFEEYLLTHTRMERASTSRYEYMSIYKRCDRYEIKLNLQVRFHK